MNTSTTSSQSAVDAALVLTALREQADKLLGIVATVAGSGNDIG